MTVKIREWKKTKQMGFEESTFASGTPTGVPYDAASRHRWIRGRPRKRWAGAMERELLVLPSPVILQKQQDEQKREVADTE